MFLSAQSFQNLSPSWILHLNLMGSLMPIFKRSTPSLVSAVPSVGSASLNFTGRQNLCHIYSVSFLLKYFYAVGFDCDMTTSAPTEAFTSFKILSFCDLQALTSGIALMWFSLTFFLFI
jgi:hypothetical protein